MITQTDFDNIREYINTHPGVSRWEAIAMLNIIENKHLKDQVKRMSAYCFNVTEELTPVLAAEGLN